MRTGAQVGFLQLVETLVRAVVGLLLGFIGFVVILTGFYQLTNINATFWGGAGVYFLASSVVGGLLLWIAVRTLNGLSRRGQSA